MGPIMAEDKTVRLEPRDPDPVRASNILAGVPARTEAMFAAFQTINQRERRAPPWRELQTLNFIRYVKMYAVDIARSYEEQRIDSVAQAMRNLLEMCIWTEFCEISEANAKRFSDDAARDMRDMMEAVQALYTSVNQTPETRLAGMIDDLKSKAPAFDIKDIDAEYIRVNNAADAVGRQLGHAKVYKAASKFAHPTALLFCMKEAPAGLLDSFYEIGAKAALTCLRHIELTIKNAYPDFRYELAARAGQ
jgi:Family of unknown function (DUF5677)